MKFHVRNFILDFLIELRSTADRIFFRYLNEEHAVAWKSNNALHKIIELRSRKLN